MRRLLADAWTLRPLSDGWELAGTAPGRLPGPDGFGELNWMPAALPARYEPDGPCGLTFCGLTFCGFPFCGLTLTLVLASTH